MKLIADATRAAATSEPHLMDVLSKSGFGRDDITVVARASQLTDHEGLREMAGHALSVADDASSVAVAKVIYARLKELLTGGEPAEYVEVLTLHDTVLELPDLMSDPTLTSVHFRRWPPRTASSRVWPAGFISLEEATSALVNVLVEESAVTPNSGIYMTELRKKLEARDSRFRKTASEAAATPGLMGMLVEHARLAGRVDRDAVGQNPRIFVVGSAAQSVTAPGTARPALRQEGPVTSDLIFETLHELRLGPFPDVRWRAYNTLETVVGTKGPLPLLDAIDQAVDECRDDVQKSDLAEKAARVPWRFVKRLIEELMRRNPVALDEDGERFSPAWGGGNRLVAGLSEDWKYELDGELDVAIWDAGIRIGGRDAEELAGALFVDRTLDGIRHIGNVIDGLVKRGVFEWDNPALGTLTKLAP